MCGSADVYVTVCISIHCHSMHNNYIALPRINQKQSEHLPISWLRSLHDIIEALVSKTTSTASMFLWMQLPKTKLSSAQESWLKHNHTPELDWMESHVSHLAIDLKLRRKICRTIGTFTRGS